MPNELPASVTWPSTWRSVPLWALFDRVKDVGHPDEEMLSVYREHGVVKKSSRNDNTNQTAEDRNIYQLIDEGWLVVNRMKAWQGSVGISPLRGIVSGHYLCFRPKHNEDPRFLNWLLRSDVYTVEYARMSRGVRPGQIEIDNEALRSLRIALPPRDEQHRIANFLDAEAFRVDKLITSISDESDLLDDRRRSLLVSVLQDNDRVGVRIGHYLELVTSGPREWSNYVGPCGTPFVRSANIRRDEIEPNLDHLALVDLPRSATAEAIRSRIRVGDVLVGITGANTGWVALADERIAQANVNQHVCLVRPSKAIDGRWLAYALSAPPIRELLLGSQYGGTKTQLSLSNIRNLTLPLPSFDIQQTTSAAISERLATITSARALRDQQVALLTERLHALITSAVTGQVDAPTAQGVVG